MKINLNIFNNDGSINYLKLTELTVSSSIAIGGLAYSKFKLRQYKNNKKFKESSILVKDCNNERNSIMDEINILHAYRQNIELNDEIINELISRGVDISLIASILNNKNNN